jgi:hypothetical protein
MFHQYLHKTNINFNLCAVADPINNNKLFKCPDDHRKYLSEIRILEDIYVHGDRQNDPITKMTKYRHFRGGEYRIPVR